MSSALSGFDPSARAAPPRGPSPRNPPSRASGRHRGGDTRARASSGRRQIPPLLQSAAPHPRRCIASARSRCHRSLKRNVGGGEGLIKGKRGSEGYSHTSTRALAAGTRLRNSVGRRASPSTSQLGERTREPRAAWVEHVAARYWRWLEARSRGQVGARVRARYVPTQGAACVRVPSSRRAPEATKGGRPLYTPWGGGQLFIGTSVTNPNPQPSLSP